MSEVEQLAELPLVEADALARREMQRANDTAHAWSAARAARIHAAIAEGLTRAEVAAELGVSAPQVTRVLRGHGYPAGRAGRPRKDSHS